MARVLPGSDAVRAFAAALTVPTTLLARAGEIIVS
jgi:hypothetical protein